MTFTKFREQSGRKLVSEMEVRELIGAASRAVTRLEYRDYRMARLDPKIFTPDGARGF